MNSFILSHQTCVYSVVIKTVIQFTLFSFFLSQQQKKKVNKTICIKVLFASC